jgi:sugar phosphate permease
MAENSTQPTNVRWYVAGLLAAAALIAYLDRVIISNVVIELQEDVGLSSFEMGWVLSAFLIGYGVMQIPMGRLGDSRPVRFLLPAIMALSSLMTGLTAAAQTFVVLFAVRLAFGMAQAGVFTCSCPTTRRWFPLASRGTAQGVIISATRCGAILAMLSAPAIALLGWQLMFVVYGAVGLVWSLIFVVWFRDRPEQHPSTNRAEVELISEPHSEKHAPPQLPLSVLLTNANMWGMSLGQFFGSMGYYLYITWFPTYLRKQYGFNLSEAGLLAAVPHMGGGIGTLVGGRVLDWLLEVTGSLRWSRRGVWLAGKASCGILFLLASQMQNPYVAVGIIGLAACLSDLGSPASWSMVTDVGGRHSGVVYGFQNTAASIGGGICPLLVPFVVGRWGWESVLPVFAGIFFACAASWLWVDATRPIRGPH